MLAVIIIVLISSGTAGGYFYAQSKSKKELDSLRDQLSSGQNCAKETSSSSSAKSSTTSSPSPTSTAKLNSAKAVVAKFIDAKKTRDLANAKPYMTTIFFNSTNQEEFAGVSSPALNRYEITGSEYLENADLYQVTAKLTYTLQGADAGYYINNYMVENDSGKFLLNEVKEGAWTEL